VSLIWRNEGQQQDDRFFLRLLDSDGYIWAEAIAQPRRGFEAANRTANTIVESEAQLVLPVGMPPGEYFFKPGFRTDVGEIIGYFKLPEDTMPVVVNAASSSDFERGYGLPLDAYREPQGETQQISPELLLLGHHIKPEGGVVWLTLYWQAVDTMAQDYVVLVRLLNTEGAEAAYWLGRPVRSGYPTNQWQPGQVVQDPWRLELPPDMEPGQYEIEIALFDTETETEISRINLGQTNLP
jgi:hypothetical protein